MAASTAVPSMEARQTWAGVPAVRPGASGSTIRLSFLICEARIVTEPTPYGRGCVNRDNACVFPDIWGERERKGWKAEDVRLQTRSF